MRFGISTRLVGTLVLAGLLPLLASLALIVFEAGRSRLNVVGRLFAARASLHAEHLSASFQSQIDFLRLINRLPGTSEFLREANRRPAPTTRQIEQTELAWRELTPSSPNPLLRSILDNELARRWQAIQKAQPRFAEVMITDRAGRLVAATNLTTDWFQADEDWWTSADAKGEGRTLIRDISFDESAISPTGAPGTLVVDVCLPIHAQQANRQEVVGIMKASVEARWLVDQVMQVAVPGDAAMRQRVWLVYGDGTPVPGAAEGAVPLPAQVFAQIRERSDGHIVTDLLPQHEMVGFAQVHLPAVAGDAKLRWYVVVTAGREAALAPIHRLLWMTGGIGAAAVLLCFFLGLVLARRQIIRPLLTLADGAHRIEQGDLDYRLPQPAQSGSVFGRDEIGRLACDFNRMADEVGRHLRAAQESDRLKAQFLDVASHELRTPITYIQGATELALRQGLSDSALVGRIAARAQHLARIVANMFKLLGSGTYESALCLGDVDLPSLIAGLRQDMAPFATQRGQTLQLRIAPDLPVLRADADKVRDILANLIDNAIRFSPDGATIRLDAQAVDSSVELAVTDAGQGLSQAQREHLFGPFAMPPADVPHHSSANGEHLWRGVDLALSVVKRFVELHEGTIATEDAQPGTRFVVRLPIRAPAAEP